MTGIKETVESLLKRVTAQKSVPLSRQLLPALATIERARHAGVPLYQIADELGVSRTRFYAALRAARRYAEKHGLSGAGSNISKTPGASAPPKSQESKGGFVQLK